MLIWICACLDLSVSSSSWGLGKAAVCDCGTPWNLLLPFFPIPLGVWDGVQFVIVALPGLFSYLFVVIVALPGLFSYHFFQIATEPFAVYFQCCL